MPFALDPAFVRIFYHTAFGQHVMTIPTLEWDQSIGTNGAGGYLNHIGNPVDAVDMIEALVNELADFQPATAEFDNAIIYRQFTPTSIPAPVRAVTLGIPGVSASADVPASQATMTMRTLMFNIVKLTWFDAAPTTDFLPQRTLPASGQPLDLFNVFSDDDWAWVGRDGSQPNQFIQVSYTLNEALRKQYRLN